MAAHQERTGRRIAEARAKAGLTQEEAAQRAGVTHRAFQRWESGEVSPYPRNLQRLAEAFGIEPEALQGESQEPPEDQLDRIEQKLDYLIGRLFPAEPEEAARALEEATGALRPETERTRSSKRSRRAARPNSG